MATRSMSSGHSMLLRAAGRLHSALTSPVYGLNRRAQRCPAYREPGLSTRTQLPNGFDITYVSKPDVSFLYQEIFKDSVYIQYGVQIRPADVIVDIGGNIGMFTLFAASLSGAQGKVLSAEPIPATFLALQDNIQRWKEWTAQQGQEVAETTPVQQAVGDGSKACLDFLYYKRAAGWSTCYPNDEEVEDGVQWYLHNTALAGLQGSSPLLRLGHAVWAWTPTFLTDILWRAVVSRWLAESERVSCSATTVSQLMQEHSLDRIDLLKIDVERSELDVLRGVAPADWPRIRQVVLEVHDVDGAMQASMDILQAAGFTLFVVQDDALRGSSLYNIYCVRH